ncbi:MAG TPA: DEAD/DEAH box helicase, partial [Ktedonobacteraceae bacterium]|nr:DEAD/DEAH box helicase [Ktedonobacteraceae bacterium]
MFPQFKSNNLYSHQVQAIQSILDACTTIISTGTGSGKTESFLIPILDHCLKHRGTSGIKALILYPINALAGDQLRRIKEASEQQGITVGSFIGSTPQSVRNHMISNPPDILITNYVMLDRLITKERPRSMFERSKYTLRFLVVDEIHYYRGTKGANLCLLLRRLRTLCADKGQLVQIGASATLRQGGGYYSDNDQEQIETFARSLFGQEATQRFKFITPIYDDFHPEEEAVDPFPGTDQPPEDFSETQTDSAAIRKLANHLAGMPLPLYFPGRKQLDPLFQFAKRNLLLNKMREELQKKACTIDELTELFRRVYYDNHHREP